ncbi:hypothetical protein SDC9_52566 [bioreactor metagenome]|uniref:Uncharacterized protein n=1 Tax=bioreactor metagenome TaxID=1076179 RepID=A0A644WRH6_9ZZZZ
MCFFLKGYNMDLITTKEAAEIWGITIRRVQALCDKEKLYDRYPCVSDWAV